MPGKLPGWRIRGVAITLRHWMVALLLLFFVLQYKLWLGPKGVPYLWEMEEDIVRQIELNQQLEACNRELRAEVIDLKSGKEALEERARSELGMVKPGELYVVSMVDTLEKRGRNERGQCAEVIQ